jgi:hypothetical protein
MPETTALAKFACPACGGEAVWNPAKQKLVCPFCGTESAAEPVSEGEAAEQDLAAALRDLANAERGWDATKREVRCASCNAISVFDPRRQAQQCEFCGSAQLVPYDETRPALRPESMLPFVVSESAARDRIRQWYGKLWFAPNALKRRALTDTVKGIYLPYWTFDAQVDAQWTAEAGHYYYTTETYSDGQRTRTRQVQHTRWEPVSGRLSHFFDDDLVCASVGVHESLLRGIEPFPTRTLRKYDSGYVAGWLVERYQVDLPSATQRARAAMIGKTQTMCAARVGGDTQRNLSVRTAFSRQTFKHILAPVWLMSYTYGATSYQVVQNGVTGAIEGEYPKSPWKIALLVIVVLALLIVGFGVVGGR